MPLRFCMVTTFFPPYNFGGDGIGIQRFCHALVRRGHHVTVVHDADAYRTLAGGREPPAMDHPAGLEVIPLHSRVPRLSALLTQQLGRPVVQRRALRELLGRGRFDVINYHNVSLVGGPGVLAMGDAVKLYMAHEHWLVCASHVLWRHDRERCDERQCLRCVLHFRRPPQLWRYTGVLERQLKHVHAFIAMSGFSRDKHREFGFPRDMEVVNYFLPDRDPAEAGADLGGPPQERPYFLFVGRLERIKGLDDVIPVFRHRPGADLLIAGDGEYAGPLKEQARGLVNVRFLGRVPPEELARYYRHARALIVPSVCYETFGIILIEAFRQGTPVLARRLGPFPEIMERAGAGALFEDEASLVGAMQRLEEEPGLREEWSRRALEAFDRHWSEQAVMPRYLEVVRAAAQRAGRDEVIQVLDAERGSGPATVPAPTGTSREQS